MSLDPSDQFAFLYQAPYANSGLVEVYLGLGGKYVFTTPFRVKAFELLEEGTILLVVLDVRPSAEDRQDIENQLRQGVLNNPGSPPATRFSDLTRQTPYSITVNLLDPAGAPVVSSSQSNEVGGRLRPLSLDLDNISFAVRLPHQLTADTVRNHRVTVESNYITKMTTLQTAVFQSTISVALQALENVVGGKPGNKLNAGDFVSRDAVQSVSRVQQVKSAVTLIDVNAGDELIAMELLNKSITKEVSFDQGSLDRLRDGYVVWTPEQGRLEVHPSSVDFEENERAIKTSSRASLQESARLLSVEARTSDSFAAWYRSRHSKQADIGTGSASTSVDADVFDIVEGSGAGSAAYSFDKSFEEMSVNAGERSKYESLFNKLQVEETVNSQIENNFESWWRGHNHIVDNVAKAFNFAVVRTFAEASNEFVSIQRLTSFGVASIPFKTNEVVLRFASERNEDIARLQSDIQQIGADLENVNNVLRATFTLNGRGDGNNNFLHNEIAVPTWARSARIVILVRPAGGTPGITEAYWHVDHSQIISKSLLDASNSCAPNVQIAIVGTGRVISIRNQEGGGSANCNCLSTVEFSG